MAIVRGPRPESNFYVLNKAISEDRRLSWAARGLLIFLLGKPDHWRVSVEALVPETAGARIHTARDGAYALLNELIGCGYATRRPVKAADGRIAEWDLYVNESPDPAEPDPAEPYVAPPDPAEPDQAEPDQAKTTLARTDKKQGLRKSKNRAARAPAKPLPDIPDGVQPSVWAEWLRHRGKQSLAAIRLQHATLARLKAEGHDPNAVITQSIERNWAGLFAIDRKRGRDDERLDGSAVKPKLRPNGSRPKLWTDAEGNLRDADGAIVRRRVDDAMLQG